MAGQFCSSALQKLDKPAGSARNILRGSRWPRVMTPSSVLGVHCFDAQQVDAAPMGEGVLAGSGWSSDFSEEVVGEWQLGASGGHPRYALIDGLRCDDLAAGHGFDGGGWLTSQADPVQQRFGAPLQRPEDTPAQLGGGHQLMDGQSRKRRAVPGARQVPAEDSAKRARPWTVSCGYSSKHRLDGCTASHNGCRGVLQESLRPQDCAHVGDLHWGS